MRERLFKAHHEVPSRRSLTPEPRPGGTAALQNGAQMSNSRCRVLDDIFPGKEAQ